MAKTEHRAESKESIEPSTTEHQKCRRTCLSSTAAFFLRSLDRFCTLLIWGGGIKKRLTFLVWCIDLTIDQKTSFQAVGFCFRQSPLNEMARETGVWNKVKETISNEFQDEEKLAAHLRLVRSVGLFLGSVLVMRNFGELMAV